VTLAVYLCLVPRLSMSGAITPHPHMTSWCGNRLFYNITATVHCSLCHNLLICGLQSLTLMHNMCTTNCRLKIKNTVLMEATNKFTSHNTCMWADECFHIQVCTYNTKLPHSYKILYYVSCF